MRFKLVLKPPVRRLEIPNEIIFDTDAFLLVATNDDTPVFELVNKHANTLSFLYDASGKVMRDACQHWKRQDAIGHPPEQAEVEWFLDQLSFLNAQQLRTDH